MNAEVGQPRVIVWIASGSGAKTPAYCALSSEAGETYLLLTLPETGAEHRVKIDAKLLLRVLPEQMEGVHYIYSKPIKLSARQARKRAETRNLRRP